MAEMAGDRATETVAKIAHIDAGPMLNIYPDSIGGSLSAAVAFLQQLRLASAPESASATTTASLPFTSIYILPSLFHSDLDRGFSIIDYDLNEELARPADLEALRSLGLALKLDFVLNHASVQSPQFQDLLRKGEDSPYRNFFINWNEFWAGYGRMTETGYIQPHEQYISQMFFRKPGLPILQLRMPNGQEKPYWNTFYQEVIREDVNAQSAQAKILGYRGQMDLNTNSPLVWEFYEETLRKFKGYGAHIVRLDAFAYCSKLPGARNFLNEPDTWNILSRLRSIADGLGLSLLPEIHSRYSEKIHERIAEKGYMIYDFFLPGLIIDAIEQKSFTTLLRWIQEILSKGLRTVNMLGCHDGIPLLDLEGLLSAERIQSLIDLVVERGGRVKNLHGKKNMYYQVNATYFSALGESEQALLLARAIQMFMPGKPQVWYLDLFAGTNDYEAVERAGEGGHKEINRTNYSSEQAQQALQRPLVQEQIRLIRFRRNFPAFGYDSECTAISAHPHELSIRWKKNDHEASINISLQTCTFTISSN